MQESTTAQPSQIINLYFNIKNALIAGNAGAASANAYEFVKAIIDSKAINNDNRLAIKI